MPEQTIDLLEAAKTDEKNCEFFAERNPRGTLGPPCWRRIQKLESSGYIKRRVALLDAEKLNLGVSVFIAVKTNQHNAEWVQRFRKIVVGFPEVVDFYRLSGDVDYLIRAVVPIFVPMTIFTSG